MVLKSTERVSVQEIAPGTYRVNARGGRSAITGRFRDDRRRHLTDGQVQPLMAPPIRANPRKP